MTMYLFGDIELLGPGTQREEDSPNVRTAVVNEVWRVAHLDSDEEAERIMREEKFPAYVSTDAGWFILYNGRSDDF